MYGEMQTLVVDDCGELIPMFNNFLDGARKNLKGFRPSPAYELSAYRAIREVWLELMKLSLTERRGDDDRSSRR